LISSATKSQKAHTRRSPHVTVKNEIEVQPNRRCRAEQSDKIRVRSRPRQPGEEQGQRPFHREAFTLIPRNTWHGFANPDQELLVLWIVTPAGLDGFFRETCNPPGIAPKPLTKEQPTRSPANMRLNSG